MELLSGRLTSHRILASVVVHLNISHLICNRVPLLSATLLPIPALVDQAYHVSCKGKHGTWDVRWDWMIVLYIQIYRDSG